MREIVVGGGLVGHGDRPEVGAFGGERSGVRVFEGDGLVTAQPETVQNEFVEIGFGFRRMRIFTARDELEAIDYAQPLQMRIDPFVRGIGCDANMDVSHASGVEERKYAGKHRLAKKQFVLASPALEFACERAR